MPDTSLYFSRSISKSVLLLTESSRMRILNIQTSRRGREIKIFLTSFEGKEATHIPVATYQNMEDAITDMGEVSQVLQLTESAKELRR